MEILIYLVIAIIVFLTFGHGGPNKAAANMMTALAWPLVLGLAILAIPVGIIYSIFKKD